MLALEKLFGSVVSILRSIWMIGMQAFNKRETRMYPDVRCIPFPRYRGRIVLTRDPLNNERCVACGLCAVACPVGCISLKKKEESESGRWYPEFFKINFARCIFCGMCEEACPTAAIQLTSDFEMSDYKKDQLVYDKSNLLISGPGKNLKYDFYRFSGVKIFGKDKGDANNEVKPISVKSILP